MNFQQKLSLLMGATGVAIGAFGAHGLKDTLIAHDGISLWNTAMHYYWVHTLAMLVFSFTGKSNQWVRITLWIWVISILLFSGSLIALSVGAPPKMGIITPFGGIGFIIGWLFPLTQKSPVLDS